MSPSSWGQCTRHGSQLQVAQVWFGPGSLQLLNSQIAQPWPSISPSPATVTFVALYALTSEDTLLSWWYDGRPGRTG